MCIIPKYIQVSGSSLHYVFPVISLFSSEIVGYFIIFFTIIIEYGKWDPLWLGLEGDLLEGKVLRGSWMEKIANVLHTKASVPLVTNALTRPSNSVYHNSIPKKYFKIS